MALAGKVSAQQVGQLSWGEGDVPAAAARKPDGPPSSLAQLGAADTQTTLPCHTTLRRHLRRGDKHPGPAFPPGGDMVIFARASGVLSL